MQSHFPSSRLALWMAMVAAWPVQGFAAAGSVQFATGDVQLRRGSEMSAATKGVAVESGDVILTGAGGRAQIRFSDGGLVALYPDSQFTVTRYSDTGDPAQEHFAVNLLRGGMRAITGLIGKRNPQNYKVTTPTAVVGIRGSAFLVAFNAQAELLVSGEQDEIEVCTEAGCVGVKAGESVRVVASNQLPLYTHTRAVLPLPPPPIPFAVGEQLGGVERVSPDVAPPPPPPVAGPSPAPVPAPAPIPSPIDPPMPPPPATGIPTPPPPPPPVTATPTPPPPATGIPTPPPPTTGTPPPPVTTTPPPPGTGTGTGPGTGTPATPPPPPTGTPTPPPPPTGTPPTPPPPTTGTPTPPPPTTGVPTTPPPVTRAPPAPTTPPVVVRPPIFTVPPIVRPIFVLPPIAIPPPPPPVIR